MNGNFTRGPEVNGDNMNKPCSGSRLLNIQEFLPLLLPKLHSLTSDVKKFRFLSFISYILSDYSV
jgi:hypothetical protein